MEDLPRTKIIAVKGEGERYRQPDKMTEFSDYQVIVQATADKVGGAESDDIVNPVASLPPPA